MRTGPRNDDAARGRRLLAAVLAVAALIMAPAAGAAGAAPAGAGDAGMAAASDGPSDPDAPPEDDGPPEEDIPAELDVPAELDTPPEAGRWSRIAPRSGRLIFRAARYGVDTAPDIARHYLLPDGEVAAEGAFWAPSTQAEPMAGLYLGAVAAVEARGPTLTFDQLFSFKDDQGPVDLAVTPLAVVPSRLGPLPVDRFRVTERDCIGFLTPIEPAAFGYAVPAASAPPSPTPADNATPAADPSGATPAPDPSGDQSQIATAMAAEADAGVPPAVAAGFHCLEPGRRYDADLAAVVVGSIGVLGEGAPPRAPLGRPVLVDIAVRALPQITAGAAAGGAGDDAPPPVQAPLGLWRGVAYVTGIGIGLRAGAEGQMLMLFAGPDAERDGPRPTICRGSWQLDSVAYEPPPIGPEWVTDPLDPIPLTGSWSMLCDGLFGDLLGQVEGRLNGRLPDRLTVAGASAAGGRGVELMLPEFTPGP
ncbi:hypothetical protein P7L78_24380 [Tistrella bauzanensis]|uniref:Uncharacterized protein n=1 Tax=Tistrella arctica TaxID=3133430 RepID=A0ABU9YJS6_9PROT